MGWSSPRRPRGSPGAACSARPDSLREVGSPVREADDLLDFGDFAKMGRAVNRGATLHEAMELHTSRNATPPGSSGAVGELGAIDRLDLHELGETHREHVYATASPWPHVVIDGLFDPAVVARARAEELGPALHLAPRRSNRRVKAESPAPAGPTAAGHPATPACQ